MRSTGGKVAIAIAAVAAIVVLFVVLSDGGDDEPSGGPSTTQAAGASGATGATGTTGAGGSDEGATGESASGQGGSGSGAAATDETEREAAPAVVVKGGKPQGGVQEIAVESGDRARFVVRSDTSDEVHVHGYDISKDVAAGGSVAFSFPASLEGVFEVELEGMGVQIAELRVSP